jgi:hypothetical protein
MHVMGEEQDNCMHPKCRQTDPNKKQQQLLLLLEIHGLHHSTGY